LTVVDGSYEYAATGNRPRRSIQAPAVRRVCNGAGGGFTRLELTLALTRTLIIRWHTGTGEAQGPSARIGLGGHVV